MASEWIATIQDYGRERSSVGFRGINVTPSNFEAQMTLMDDLYSAIQGVIVGTVEQTTRVASRALITSTPPLTALAQRENKWLVQALDDVTQRAVTFEIPCADLTLLLPNSEEMNQTSENYMALVDAIEAYARSVEGNSISVQRIVFVARNT